MESVGELCVSWLNRQQECIFHNIINSIVIIIESLECLFVFVVFQFTQSSQFVWFPSIVISIITGAESRVVVINKQFCIVLFCVSCPVMCPSASGAVHLSLLF